MSTEAKLREIKERLRTQTEGIVFTPAEVLELLDGVKFVETTEVLPFGNISGQHY